MIGEQDADAFGFEVADEMLDVGDRDRVDAGEGFVEQQTARIGGQGAGDLGAAPLAPGKTHALARAHMADVEFLEQGFETVPARLPVEVLARFENGENVLFNAQGAENRRVLGQIGQTMDGAAVDRQRSDLVAVDEHVAGVGSDQPDHHVEAGGLAGAVGTEQADDFAAADAQRDIVHHLASPVTLDQAGCFQHGLSRSPG